VVWEGVEGSGKTTLMNEVCNSLREMGYRVLTYKTPSKTKTGRFAKEYGNEPMIDSLTRTLLFLANTSDDSRIMKREIVENNPDYYFIDRYYLCSIVYGFAYSKLMNARVDEEDFISFLSLVEKLGEKIFIKPNLYIIVDVPEEFRVKRIDRKGAGKGLEGRLEKNSKMQEYVRRFYRAFVEEYPDKTLWIINPEGKLDEACKAVVRELLRRRESPR